jgi:hypothetical protein
MNPYSLGSESEPTLPTADAPFYSHPSKHPTKITLGVAPDVGPLENSRPVAALLGGRSKRHVSFILS